LRQGGLCVLISWFARMRYPLRQLVSPVSVLIRQPSVYNAFLLWEI